MSIFILIVLLQVILEVKKFQFRPSSNADALTEWLFAFSDSK